MTTDVDAPARKRFTAPPSRFMHEGGSKATRNHKSDIFPHPSKMPPVAGTSSDENRVSFERNPLAASSSSFSAGKNNELDMPRPPKAPRVAGTSSDENRVSFERNPLAASSSSFSAGGTDALSDIGCCNSALRAPTPLQSSLTVVPETCLQSTATSSCHCHHMEEWSVKIFAKLLEMEARQQSWTCSKCSAPDALELPLPYTSVESLKGVKNFTAEQRVSLKRRLELCVVHHSMRKSVKAILTTLATPEVLSLFSGVGRKAKESFCDINVMPIIEGAVLRFHKSNAKAVYQQRLSI